MGSSVIVGVDGSPSADRAVTFGGALAVRHGLPLRVLHVFSWPALYPPFLPPEVAVQLDPRALSRQIVDTAAAAARDRFPGLAVDTGLIDGDPAGSLVNASGRATYLVVGHRGRGGFAELLLGSVGVHTTAHARCPVVVVRGDEDGPEAPVVVGVDGSMPARAAARYAFAEARARGTDLVAALAWPPARSWPEAVAAAGLPPHPAGVDPIEVSLGAIADEFPDVKVRRELRNADSPPHMLAALAAETGAGLLVVGSRGLGGFRSLLMGGTSRALVDHAPCPVLVVPPGAAS